MPYWPLGLWFFGLALSMGWIMGPATDSVMGAVPEEKAGVASAMSDVTRQVAGALGIAVIGSLIASLYARASPTPSPRCPGAATRPRTPSAAPTPWRRSCPPTRAPPRRQRGRRLHRRARPRAHRRRGRRARGAMVVLRRLPARPAAGAAARRHACARHGGRERVVTAA